MLQGPFATFAHVLTTCFDDAVLEPLFSFFFILFTLTLLLMAHLRRRPVDTATEHKDTERLAGSDGTMPRRSLTRRICTLGGGKWPKVREALLWISLFLLVALVAMHVLEIARLSVDNQGIGLLPATLVPIIIVAISLFLPTPAWSRGRWSRPARPHGEIWVAGVSLWCLWMIITVGIKLWSYSAFVHTMGEATFNAVNSAYLYGDRLVSRWCSFHTGRKLMPQIDNIVILCVYWAFLLCYLQQMYFEYIRYDLKVFP